MHRITTGLLLAILAAFMLGCGGSSAPIPGNGNNPSGNDGEFAALPDVQIVGNHGVTNLPGQVNVVAGGDRAKLEAIADKFGYQVLKYSGGYGTLQVPQGTEQQAITTLEKEYAIIKAEPVRVIHMPRPVFDTSMSVKSASFYPRFPDYGETTMGLATDGTNWGTQFIFQGQALPMNAQNFPGGWAVTIDNPSVASQPVSIAIIDAGWFDYSLEDQPGLNDAADDADVPGTNLDLVNSGYVDGLGTFTPGLTAATWEVDPANGNYPIRINGAMMLGALAGGGDGFIASVQAADLDGTPDGIQSDEIWNVGIMGANPNASFMLIKTGVSDGATPPAWTFSDNEIAESIDHAVASGANIILLGMFAPGTVSANVSAAIANARANDVLVIAPAGDVMASYDQLSNSFSEVPVDIQTSPVTPASDPNVVSVAAGGSLRAPDALNPIDFGGGPVDNPGTGWFPDRFPLDTPPLATAFTALTPWTNTGATVAATGFGLGFGPAPYLTNGSGNRIPGIVYTNSPQQNYGSYMSAAYIAGAASMIFQTLSEVNGTPPTDDEVLAELLSTVQFKGMVGVDDPTTAGPDDGGLLNAGLAVTSAVNGGSLVSTLPALEMTNITASQPFAGVTRGTDFALTVTIVNGTAPFELTIDWGDGSAPTVVPNWTNADPVTKTGGYAEVGRYAINITVEDDNGLSETFAVGVTVTNPLSASISIESATGAAVPAAALKAGTTYRFNANPGNVFTGGGNVTTFSWDFNGDATEDETGPTPTFAFPGAGNFTVTLTVQETLRPDTTRTLDVVVSP